ncbi:hypothetical protein [Pleionea sp. CnH1-48]|uniref:hypothetical protein n=1 Tax=Pleionea sp. CnH1-48 TaxID=2954494 RepID=UPI0020975EC4|nr:hypothetical protein [Pleionea sp. CnH1-48]MCO7225933.1 hypothetical protein [Pleionea sp. CnH1-48]
MGGGGGGSARIDETPEEQKLAEIAKQKWIRYKEEFRPFEDKLYSELRMDESDHRTAKGINTAHLNQQYNQVQQQVQEQQRRQGTNPNSGRYKKALDKVFNAQSQGTAFQQSQTDLDVENQHYLGLQKMVNIGRGIQDDSEAGLMTVTNDAANQAAHQAGLARKQTNNNASGFGQFAGMAASAWGNLRQSEEQ